MSNKVSDYYNAFSERQISAGIHHRHLAIQRWLEKFNMSKSGNTLEIGCGVGTQTQLLLEYLNPNTKLTAIDISEKNIELAKYKLSKFKNLKLIAADVIDLNITGKFETIVLPDVIEHIPIEKHYRLFEKLSKLLSNSGFILIHIPDPYYLEWLKENRPEDLQIIDNPVYTNILSNNIYPHNLYISYLESYSIFNTPADYQVIVLKKKTIADYKIIEKPIGDSFNRRLNRKFNQLKRR